MWITLCRTGEKQRAQKFGIGYSVMLSSFHSRRAEVRQKTKANWLKHWVSK